MKKLLIILAAVAVLGVGATVAQSSTRGPDRIPVEELTRQLDAFEAKLMDQEHAIAICMDNKGFEYIPHVPADWVMERAVELDHANGGTGDVDIEAPTDPNAGILAGLSPDQVDAYQTAYWGSPDEVGCYNTTYEQVFGVDRTDELERLTAVADQVDAAMEIDPRITAARSVYVTCMHNQGYEVAGIDDVFRMIDERREPIESTATAEGVAVDQVADYSSYVAFKNSALDAHDACASDYHAVEDDVKAEYVDRFLNQP